jgi:hypothetical protein
MATDLGGADNWARFFDDGSGSVVGNPEIMARSWLTRLPPKWIL